MCGDGGGGGGPVGGMGVNPADVGYGGLAGGANAGPSGPVGGGGPGPGELGYGVGANAGEGYFGNPTVGGFDPGGTAGQQAEAAGEGPAPMNVEEAKANLNSVFAEIDKANADNLTKNKAIIAAVAKTIGGLLAGSAGSMAIAAIVSSAFDALTANGMNAAAAHAALNAVSSGEDAQAVADSITSADFSGAGPGDQGGPSDYTVQINKKLASGGQATTGGGPGGGAAATTSGGTSDPTSYNFWNDFVDEWLGKNNPSAKAMTVADDAFRKAQLQPAFTSYADTLKNLGTQAQAGTGLYSPVKFGMGDFRASFVPKSQLRTAQDIKDFAKSRLGSVLALTDVMQPYRGTREYLDSLQKIAQWKAEIDQAKALALKGYKTQEKVGTYEPKDKGTWLDTIKDVVQVGDTVGDVIKKYF